MAGRKQLAYSADSETAKVKKIIEVFELENPLLKSLPTKYRQLYDTARRADIAAGIQPVDFMWQGDPWTSWSGGTDKPPKVVNRYHYNLQQKIKRAKRLGKYIELEDYLKHPSLKDDPELAKQLFEHNNKQLKRISRFSSTKLHDDHISPRSKAEYGWEVGRNKQLLGVDDNLMKSDMAPSDALMERLGIGKTKAEQIDLLRSSPIDPDTGGRYTPRKVRQLVQKDLGLKFTKGMGKVNDLSGINGYVKKASTAAKAGQTGKALKAGIGLATLGSLSVIGPAGAALGAIDTAQRTNKYKQTGNRMDGIQAWMAGASTATAATGIGEVVSMPLDIVNLIIDAARYKRTGPIQGSRARFN